MNTNSLGSQIVFMSLILGNLLLPYILGYVQIILKGAILDQKKKVSCAFWPNQRINNNLKRLKKHLFCIFLLGRQKALYKAKKYVFA